MVRLFSARDEVGHPIRSRKGLEMQPKPVFSEAWVSHNKDWKKSIESEHADFIQKVRGGGWVFRAIRHGPERLFKVHIVNRKDSLNVMTTMFKGRKKMDRAIEFFMSVELTEELTISSLMENMIFFIKRKPMLLMFQHSSDWS